MSSFHDISFEPPGYPIYRAFIIPYRRNRELCDAVEIGAKEVAVWREMLENLRAFLLNAIESLEERGIELTDHERLELTGDLISLFLRIPLNREVLPSISPSPLKAYMLMRLMRLEELFKEWEFNPIDFTYTFYDAHLRRYLREEKRYPKLSKILRDLETTEVSDLLESCWLLIPADTRPALNTASLVSHLLLTSAITWSMAVNKGIKNRRIMARLRIAALLHDIGKPFKYRDHVKASAEITERLLSELLPKEDIDFISECIKDHHDPKTEQGKIISEADRHASAIDRLKKLLYHEYFKDIKCKLEEAAKALNYDNLEKAFEDWDFWHRVYEKYDRELIRSLSEEFVKRIREMTRNFTIMPPRIEDESEAKPVGLRIVLIDVGGIQDFIYKSYSLRQVAAASLVIDSFVMAYIVAYLQWAISAEYWLPYEAFLYTAGGNIELLIPRKLVDNIKNEISRLNKRLIPDYGISLRVVDAELYTNKVYSETVKELIAKMSVKKIHVDYEEYSAVVPSTAERGIRNVCQSCFMEPPIKKILTPEGEIAVCKACYGLHEIGFNIHFMEKYVSETSICGKIYRPEEVFKIPWDGGEGPVKASERIMEIIAGHDGEELQKLDKLARMRNIAVIKVDGTLMGPLMATCLSIADAYERSARIDVALKKSIETTINEIYNGVLRDFGETEAAETAISIKMGILYAGGDDAVILAPSWASPLIALALGKEFFYNLGCARSLSIGVAAASPKANIWALIDASSELMRKAKKEARKEIEKGTVESMICFDIVEAGDLSSSTIKERFNTLEHEKLTAQPFNMNDFEKMLCSILKLDSRPEYSEIARLSYLASRNTEILEGRVRKDLIEQIREKQDELKGIRRAISETLQMAKSIIIRAGDAKQYEKYVFPIAYIYACRQIARAERVKKEQYEFVKSLIPDNLDAPSSLSDVDRLIKIIGGGVI